MTCKAKAAAQAELQAQQEAQVTSSNMLLYIAHHRRQSCMMMQLWSTGDQENGLAEPQVAQLMWDRHQDAVCAAINHNQAICRNKRLLLAYNNLRLERIKAHRWYSRTLPDDFRQSMSPGEHQFWKKYDKTLSDFMRNGMGISLDLTAPWCLRQDLEPPCDPTVQVKVERDFGAIVDADGTTHLDKGTVLSMSREEAEPLIRQGVLSLWHQEGYRI
eukprot:jgi/Astpho2/9199/Aster-07157